MIEYSDLVAEARLLVVLAAIDGGGGAGKLVIGTSALSGATGVLVTIPLDSPSGTVAGRTLTFAGTPIDASATASGVAAKAEVRDNADVVIASGLTVGVSGGGSDITMDATGLVTGRPVRLVSASITTP
jgi:hypothetical protein